MHKGFVLLNCDLGAEEFIVEELRKISQVSQAYVTFGAYDVIAVFFAYLLKRRPVSALRLSGSGILNSIPSF